MTGSSPENDDVMILTKQYMGHVRRSNRGHYAAAEHLTGWHRRLGVLAAIGTAAVGTSIFATINESPESRWRIIAGLATLMSAVLVTLQTTLNLDNRAAEHRAAGAAYGRLRRRFELFVASESERHEESIAAMEKLRALVAEMDQLGDSAPLIPPSADRQAKTQLQSQRPSRSKSTHPD